jgi:hypothetical protein
MASMPAATIYPQSHVGFDSITSQIERKLLKRGFQFNVICVGQYSRSSPPARCLLHLVYELGLTCLAL